MLDRLLYANHPALRNKVESGFMEIFGGVYRRVPGYLLIQLPAGVTHPGLPVGYRVDANRKHLKLRTVLHSPERVE